jgi:uncharacterized Zn-binding protein involved in type VI secretion
MGRPAAKMNDRILGVDIHIVMIPAPPAPPVPTPLPLPFAGTINGGCSTNVKIQGQPAAVMGSTAVNTPSHIPPGGPFQKPPTNQGRVLLGSPTVKINGKAAARLGDPAMTCNDPTDLPTGTVMVVGPPTVMIGP